MAHLRSRRGTAAVIAVGRLSLVPIIDAVNRRVPTVPYFATTEEQWAAHAEFLDDDGMLSLPLSAYLLRAGDRTVLVDAGIGPNAWEFPEIGASFPAGRLLDELRVVGVDPSEVTDIVFTHLHFDHIGWAAVDGEPMFPNADLHCHVRDWEFFIEGGGEGTLGGSLVAPLLAPVIARFVTWDRSCTLFPGVDVVDAPGHTPGSSIVVLSSGRARAVLLGDAVHCPVELVDEEWQTIGDVDPELARRTATHLAREFEGEEVLLGAAHFKDLQFGRLIIGEGRRQWSVAPGS